MASSPIFRRITLTEVKKTSNKRGSLLKELATLEKEEKEILKNHHDPSYSNWRASFLIEDGMNTSGFMQSTLTSQGDTNLETIEGNVETSYQAYEGGSDALSNTAITSSGTGSGTDGGFDLGKDYLGFNGNSTPRYAALKPIDATKYDTIVLTGIRGNDSNGGEDPDAADEDLMIYYQLPGENTIQRLDYSGGVQQSGVDYKIIPVGSGDGTLKDWSIGLPSYARAENIRFILYQPTHHGTGFDNYGVTEINYQRRAPLTVFVSLDSPEASAFIRTGSPSRASQSKKQREKQLREQLEASKDYTDKKFGENFPGSTTPAPGEEDPTEQEKRAPRLGEYEPEVVDYNTWKQETEEENPQAKTSEAEYQKYVDTIEKEKSFAALRSDQQPSAPEAAPVIKTDSEGKVDFNDFKQIQIKKEVTKLNTAITTEIKDGDNEGALKDVDKILKVQPDNAEAKLMKATVERRLGDTESADKDQSEGLKDYAKNPDWNVPELKAPSEIESQQKTEAQTLVQGLIDGDEEIISQLKPEEQSAYREFMQRLKDQGEGLGEKFSELATAIPPFASFLLQNAGITTHTEENPRVVPLPSNVTTDVKNTINNYLNNNVDPKDWSNLSQKDLKALNKILEDTMGQEYWKTVGQIGRPDAFAEHIKVDDQGTPYVDGLSDTYTFQSKYEDALGDAYFGLPDKLIRLTSGLNPNMDTPYEYTLESGEKIPIANMPMQVNFSDDKPDLTQSIQNVIKNPELLDTVSQAGNQVADQVKDGLETFVDNASEAISAMTDEFMMDLQPLTNIPDALSQAGHAAHVTAGYVPYWIGVSNLTNSPLNIPSVLTPQSEINDYAEMLGVSYFDGNNNDGPDGESVQIPIVSVAKPYADGNIVVNPDGSVSRNDGTHGDRTGIFPGGGDSGNVLADAGQAQVQVVIPHDGSEPYVLRSDWAYYNTDSVPGDGEVASGFLQNMANAVTDLSNWIHGRPTGGENTGGMAGFPSNIRGAVSNETKIPLSSLPIESQEYIMSSELYQTRNNSEVAQYYNNLDKTPPGAPQSWDLMNTEQKVHWLDNHQDNLITSEFIEKEPIDDLTPEQISELTPEEQVAAELTPFEHQDLEAQLETIYEENPEYIDQMVDDYFDSPEQQEYNKETGDLYNLIKKEKSEAYSKWSKEKNAKADKLWDEYQKFRNEYKALADKEYLEYLPTQEWYNYPEYLSASDKEKPAAAKAAKAKAARARTEYFDRTSPRDREFYAQSSKLSKEYNDQRVIKTGEYEEYLAKNPNHNKKEQEAQKKLDSMIAANTIRMDAFMMDVIAEYNAGQNYGPPQGWPTNPDEYQDFDVSQTDQLIASAAKDAQELRWILNSGIPLTEKQRNDLIDRINGIKKSEGGLDPLGNIASNIPRGDSVPIDPKTGQPYPYGPTQFPGGNPQAKIAAKQTDGSVLTPTDAALVAGGNYAPYYTDFETQTAQNVLQNAPDDWDPVEEYGPGSKADAQQMDNYLNSLPPAVLDDLKNPTKPDHNLLNLMLAMTAGGRVINQLGAAAQAIERFWNKGKDARVKGEDTASWKDLWKDDRAQLGRSDANFQAGKPGNPLGRPDQAFNPFRPADKGGFLSAPTPLVRQVGGRLTKPGMALGSQLNPDGTPRTAQQIQGTDAGAEVGTAQQPFGGGPPEDVSNLTPPEGYPDPETDPDAYQDFDPGLTDDQRDSLEKEMMQAYEDNPEFAEFVDAEFDNFLASNKEYSKFKDGFKTLNAQEKAAKEEARKERTAEISKRYNAYKDLKAQQEAISKEKYNVYRETQQWYKLPEYVKAEEKWKTLKSQLAAVGQNVTTDKAQYDKWVKAEKEYPAAEKAFIKISKEVRAKAEKAREAYFAEQEPRDKKDREELDKLYKSYESLAVIKDPDYWKKVVDTEKVRGIQKEIESLRAQQTRLMDQFMMDLMSQYNDGSYGEKESPFPEDPASDAVGGLGADDGDELAWGGKKPKGPPTTKTRNGALDATKASTGMYPDMTPEKFKEKYGMSYNDYLNLPQAGQRQSSTDSGTQIAMNQGPSSPIKYYPDSDRYLPDRGGAGPGKIRPKGPAAFPTAKKRLPQKDFGSVADVYGGQGVDAATLASVAAQTQGSRPKKKKLRQSVTASYKPKGSIIIEKRQLKSPNQFFNPDDIKPDYPKDPPPEMVNNYHPDLASGEKVSQRFNKLDPASAKAMPKTGNPHIDAKVEKAKNNPDKDGPAWHKKVTDKIRKARAQQRTGTGQSNGDDSNGNGGEG